MNILHEEVVNLINQYRNEHGDPPEKMMFLYDYLHKKHIDAARKVKVMQGMFME